MNLRNVIYVLALTLSVLLIINSCNKKCDGPKCYYINERASVKLGKEITIMDTTRMVIDDEGNLVPFLYHIKYTQVVRDSRDYTNCSFSQGGVIYSEVMIYTDSSCITDTLEFRGCNTEDEPQVKGSFRSNYYSDLDHKTIYFLKNRPLAIQTGEAFKYKREKGPYTLELILKDN